MATKQVPPHGADKISQFYNEMLKTWARVHIFPPRDEEEVRSEVIWDNTFTSSPRQTLSSRRWNRWITAGITTVNDICHTSENRLLGQNEIATKFGIRVNFLEALSIRNSIPHSWRSKLSKDYTEQATLKYTMVINQKTLDILQSGPKGWYTELIKTQKTPIKRQESWETELSSGEGDLSLNWPGIYTRPYKTTRETKLQSFAFKIAHRLTPCNKYLNTIRTKNDPACEICKEVDSLKHFFIKCPPTEDFWNKLSGWCEQHLDFSLSTLTEAEKLFGVEQNQQNRNMRVHNWLILKAKYYIQKRKLFFKGDLSLIGFLAEVRSSLSTERMACNLENRPRKFRPWWKLYVTLG